MRRSAYLPVAMSDRAVVIMLRLVDIMLRLVSMLSRADRPAERLDRKPNVFVVPPRAVRRPVSRPLSHEPFGVYAPLARPLSVRTERTDIVPLTDIDRSAAIRAFRFSSL